MKFEIETMQDCLEVLIKSMQELNLGLTKDAEAIEKFYNNGIVIAIASISGVEQKEIAGVLSKKFPEVKILQIDLERIPDLKLWDILIVLTPADQALSHKEEIEIKNSVQNKIPTFLMVVGLQYYIEELEEIRQELIEFRLKPILGSIKVSWGFYADNDITSLSMYLSTVISLGLPHIHNCPTKNAIRYISEASRIKLQEELKQHDIDNRKLQEFQQVLPLMERQFPEESNMAILRYKDVVRSIEDSLYEGAYQLVDASVIWVTRNGLGEWSDVVQDFYATWNANKSKIEYLLEQQSGRFREQLEYQNRRITKFSEDLDLFPNTPLEFRDNWYSTEFEQAIQLFLEIKVELITQLVLEDCQECLANQSKTQNILEEESEESDISVGLDKLRSGVSTLKETLSGLSAPSFESELKTKVISNMAALFQKRIERLLEVGVLVVDQSTKVDSQQGIEQMREKMKQYRSELSQRYHWGEAYKTLLDIETWCNQYVF